MPGRAAVGGPVPAGLGPVADTQGNGMSGVCSAPEITPGYPPIRSVITEVPRAVDPV